MRKFKNKDGYVLVKAEDHPRAYFGKVSEHVLVMEHYLGRYLPKGTVVHHINRKRADNRIENLLLLRSEADHFALHRAMNSENKLVVEAFENWSREFMDNLKAGLPEDECFGSSMATQKKKTPKKSVDSNIVKISDYKKRVLLKSQLIDELKLERRRLASDNQVPAYIIFHDKTLIEMAEVMPSTKESMLEISGVGPVKLRSYGLLFLKLIKKFKKDNNL